MKILIYNWRDIKNPEAGGAEVFTHENAKRWVEKGHNVTWFTSSFPGCKKEEVIDGIDIIRDGGKYTVYLKAREYYKKFFKGRFDVIIDEINTIPFFTPEFVNNGEKIVVLIHQLAREFWFYETPLPAAILGRYFLEDYWLKQYRNIRTVTVSESTKKDLIDLGFKNVSIVPEGISFKPLEKVTEKEKDPTLIFVGRLKKAKLPDHAIRAFKMVQEKIPNAKLWIVGNGYYRSKLENMAGKGVEFFGWVSTEKKLELMSRAWAILVPGIREGWGLIVTEANAMGTPAIGYNVHGLRDSIRNNYNGILANGYEEISERAIDLISNRELCEKLSVRALESARYFSWDRSAKETLEVILNA
jgi:glycosyltransferase involved in cell wall biosynthesis